MGLDRARSCYCPICHGVGSTYLEFEKQTLYRCQGCASLFYFPFVIGGWGSLYEPLESEPFYLQRGANLLFYTEIIHFLHDTLVAQTRIDPRRPPDVLEVGCSYGFLMDIARWLHGWNVAGVDPDPCAAQGREDLGLDITQSELEEIQGEDLHDAIISVETAEHVHDLRQHFSSMARLLRENGLMILTTPDASARNLGPNLWPGKHHVIFSQNGLGQLLNEVGMQHHHWFKTSIPELLGVIASRESFSAAVTSSCTLAATNEAIRTSIDYLRFKIPSTRQPAFLVQGLHFRLFELLVNLGRYSEAEPIGQTLDRLLGLEPDHRSPSNLGRVVHSMMDAPDSKGYLAAGPGCLAPYLFYKGILHLNHRSDYSGASEFFGYAAQLFRKEVEEFDLTHFQMFLTAAESNADRATLLAQKPVPWHKRLFHRAASWRHSQ